MNTIDTLSDIGSIAKTFTAAAIFRLIKQKKLSLDSKLSCFFTNLPENKKDISISQLLTHTSGLDNFHSKSDFESMSKEEALKRILILPVAHVGVDEVNYSNAGYTLLAMIVEEVSKTDFKNYIHNEIIDELSLKNTGFYNDKTLINKPVAIGYDGDSAFNTYEQAVGWALLGSGGMFSNVFDMVKWINTLKSSKLFSTDINNLIFNKSINGKWTFGNVKLKQYANRKVREVGGSTDYGYTILIQYIKENELLIIAMLNGYSSAHENYTHHVVVKDIIHPILFSN